MSTIPAILATTGIALASSLISRSSCISADNLIDIAPDTTTCNGADFPRECVTASAAAPNIASSFELFNIDSFDAQAALVAIMLFESGDFKYKQNHFPAPGTPGQGTRNMQSPAFNEKYADWIAANGEDENITEESVAQAKAQGPPQLLDLINTDLWGFASAAWFLSTQCDASIAQALGDAQQASFENYLTTCVGTTVTADRITGWEKVVALRGW